MNKKYIIFDVDGTLVEPKQKISKKMLGLLKKLTKKYILVLLGARECYELFNQLLMFSPIEIFGSYGLEYCSVKNSSLIKKYNTNYNIWLFHDLVVKAADFIRVKYNFQNFKGNSIEIHKNGWFTFPLLGTTANYKDKIIFDPDASIRQQIYPILKHMLPDNEILIGGTNSFDILPKGINKAFGIKQILFCLKCCKKEIIYIGNDFRKWGNDYIIKKIGIDFINVENSISTEKKLLTWSKQNGV